MTQKIGSRERERERERGGGGAAEGWKVIEFRE